MYVAPAASRLQVERGRSQMTGDSCHTSTSYSQTGWDEVYALRGPFYCETYNYSLVPPPHPSPVELHALARSVSCSFFGSALDLQEEELGFTPEPFMHFKMEARESDHIGAKRRALERGTNGKPIYNFVPL